MSNMANNTSFLTGAAGQDTSGPGAGDYFGPGTHKVQIVKVEAGPSKKPPHLNMVVVEGCIVKGGEGTELYRNVNGMVVKLEQPGILPAPHKGRKQAQVLVAKPEAMDRFQQNLGNFALNAKKTFMAVYKVAEAAGPEALQEFLANKGLTFEQVKDFVARGKENPNTTVGQDILDVFTLDLPVGLVMIIDVVQYRTVKGALTTVSTWKAGGPEDLALLAD